MHKNTPYFNFFLFLQPLGGAVAPCGAAPVRYCFFFIWMIENISSFKITPYFLLGVFHFSDTYFDLNLVFGISFYDKNAKAQPEIIYTLNKNVLKFTNITQILWKNLLNGGRHLGIKCLLIPVIALFKKSHEGSITYYSGSPYSHHHSTNSSWLPQTSQNWLVNINEPHMTWYDLTFYLTWVSRLAIIDLHWQ